MQCDAADQLNGVLASIRYRDDALRAPSKACLGRCSVLLLTAQMSPRAAASISPGDIQHSVIVLGVHMYQ